MDLLDLIKERKSVRRFLPRDIEQEKLDYIMECARLAPSAANKQPWKFLLVRSKEKRELLKQCYQAQWFQSSECPYYIVACGDTNQSWKRRFDGKDHCDVDITIAVEHICLAVHEQGLGTCWICAFDAALMKKLFEMPDNMYPLVILPVGYPDEDFGERTGRKGLEDIVEVI